MFIELKSRRLALSCYWLSVGAGFWETCPSVNWSASFQTSKRLLELTRHPEVNKTLRLSGPKNAATYFHAHGQTIQRLELWVNHQEDVPDSYQYIYLPPILQFLLPLVPRLKTLVISGESYGDKSDLISGIKNHPRIREIRLDCDVETETDIFLSLVNERLFLKPP